MNNYGEAKGRSILGGNKLMKARLCAAVLTALISVFVLASTSRAQVTNLAPGQTINLASVLDATGKSVQIGDKLFDDFFFSYIDTDNNVLNELVAADVTLTALANDIGFGLSFQTPLITFSNVVKDIVVKYSVLVLDPNQKISDAHLSFSASVLGLGTADVNESLYTGGFGANQLDSFSVHLPPPGFGSTGVVFSTPQVKIYMEKDVVVSGNGSTINDRASITIINQTFSQIPEPSALVLVGAGLSGLLFFRRRSR